MELGFLVLLQYAQNPCYVEVMGVRRAQKNNPSLEIDLVNETWSLKDKSDTRNIPIGKAREIKPSCRSGPIGVYDRREIEHLKNMVQDALNAVREGRYSED